MDGLEGTFIVLRSEGTLRAHVPDAEPREHWEILLAMGVSHGWSERLLTELSEAIDEAG